MNKTGSGFFNKTNAGGFTLVEIMAVLVVFSVILFVLAQLTSDTTALVRRSNRGMDGDSQARQIFSFLAGDLEGMPHRLDLDYSLFKHNGFTLPDRYQNAVRPANAMPGNDTLAFISDDPAGSGSGSGASLIAWKIGTEPGFNGPVLQRLRLPLGWEEDASGRTGMIYLPNTISERVPDLLALGDYELMGEHVFRMEYQYLLRSDSSTPATRSILPFRDGAMPEALLGQVSAIVVTIAVLDAESRKLCGNLDALVQCLPDAEEGKDTAEVWNGILQSPGFATQAQIPQAAASGVRVYQRFLSLPELE